VTSTSREYAVVNDLSTLTYATQ